MWILSLGDQVWVIAPSSASNSLFVNYEEKSSYSESLGEDQVRRARGSLLSLCLAHSKHSMSTMSNL